MYLVKETIAIRMAKLARHITTRRCYKNIYCSCRGSARSSDKRVLEGHHNETWRNGCPRGRITQVILYHCCNDNLPKLPPQIPCAVTKQNAGPSRGHEIHPFPGDPRLGRMSLNLRPPHSYSEYWPSPATTGEAHAMHATRHWRKMGAPGRKNSSTYWRSLRLP